MNPELAKLVHLQELEQQAHALEAQLAGYAERVAARRSTLLETGHQLEQNAISQAKEAALRRRMESDTEDLRLKSARYRVQLDDVQSESQRMALEHQITFCKQEINSIEEQEFSSLVETEALETRERMLHETFANQTQALEVERTTAQLGQVRDQAALAELHLERDAVRKTVDPQLLAQYDRISGARKLAVAAVEQQRCSACQMMLRPQRWNEVREGAMHFCESCGRFLYYDPAIDLSDAIQLPAPSKKSAGPATGPATGLARVRATGSGPSTRED
ncbi:MAG: C4-type zinc ribbon domain-containing protein [Acidobacteriaceae bacterium]